MLLHIPGVLDRAQVARFRAALDGAVMALPPAGDVAPGYMRSDVSCTLFLSEPEAYDGGGLVVDDTYGEHEVKLPAGDLIVYPSSSLHRVAPVTRGERRAAVGWIQSHVRDPRRRGVLFTLDQARRSLHARDGGSAEFLQLSQVHSQLLRMWAET